MRTAVAVSRPFLLTAVLILPACLTTQNQEPRGLESNVDSLVATFMAEHPAPSIAVGIWVGGVFTLEKAFGLADLEDEVPATPQSVYRAASLTKQFTAAAILQLAEKGLLTLDGDLSDYCRTSPRAGIG